MIPYLITYDYSFFLNAVFHVTDPSGRKVTDKITIYYIEKVGTHGIAEI